MISKPGSLNKNCFLSEFPDSVPRINWGLVFAVLTFTVTSVILVLGEGSNSNGICVKLTPVLTGASPGLMSELVWWKGYLGDLNHGFFYLIIMPLCLVLLWHFFEAADKSLREVASNESDQIADLVSMENKDAFRGSRPLIFWLVLLLIAWNWLQIDRSLASSSVRIGSVKCVGYTEREFFHLFAEKFEHATTLQKMHMIKDNAELNKQFKIDMHRKLLSEKNAQVAHWGKCLTASGQALTPDDAIRRYKLGEPVDMDLEKAAEEHLFELNLRCNAQELDDDQKKQHFAFLVLIVILEGSCHAIGIWALLKFLFWLRTVWCLLPQENRPTEGRFQKFVACILCTGDLFWRIYIASVSLSVLRIVAQFLRTVWRYAFSIASICKGLQYSAKPKFSIVPNFEDESLAYGMKPLYSTYNLILYILVSVGFVVLTQWINNINSGLIVANELSFQKSTSIFLMLSVGTGVVAIFLGPILLFGKRMESLKQQKIKKLKKQMAKSDLLGEFTRDEFNEKLELIRKQQTWPKNDRYFQGALGLALILCISPFALNFIEVKSLPGMDDLNKIIDAHTLLKAKVDSICESRYGKQIPPRTH